MYLSFAQINTPQYAVPVVASFVAAGIVLHQVNYRWMSFVSIFTIGHIISFSVGTLIVQSLSHYSLAIETELWETTPQSLWALVLGMAGLSLGVQLTRVRLVKRASRWRAKSEPARLTPAWFNVALMALVIPQVIFAIKTGTFYHKDVNGVDAYNFDSAASFGFVGYFTYVSYVGTVLQIRRYLLTKTRRDLYGALVCCCVPLLVMLPSGSRSQTLIFLVMALLCYLEWETRTRLKYIVLSSSVVLLTILSISIEMYRISASLHGAASFSQRIVSAAEFMVSNKNARDEERSKELGRAILGRRLSDNHSLGFLMKVIPQEFPHRGFEGMAEFPYYVLPTVLRPNVNLDYNYDAALMMDRYRFRPDIGGSSPMLIIGEWYERFGLTGIFFGMVLTGLLLRSLDLWIAGRGAGGIMLWAMFFNGVTNMYAYSLLKIFNLLTRQLVIFLIIVWGLKYLLRVLSHCRERIFSAEGQDMVPCRKKY